MSQEEKKFEMDEETREAAKKTRRKRSDPRKEQEQDRSGGRIPLGGLKQRLQIADKDPAFHYRWINDKAHRIRDALMAGYQPVLSTGDEYNPEEDDHQSTDQWIKSKVSRTESGDPLIAYLFKIKKEWYDEDQAAKRQAVDTTEQEIYQGNVGNPEPGTVYNEPRFDNQFKR